MSDLMNLPELIITKTHYIIIDCHLISKLTKTLSAETQHTMQQYKILQNPRRKAQMTKLLIEFLQGIKMSRTAQILTQESKIVSKAKTFDEQIKQIQEHPSMTKNQKDQIIRGLLQKYFVKQIKQDNNQEALMILKGPMVKYFQNVDKFSTYFLEPPETKNPHLTKFLTPYFSRTKDIILPKHRVCKGQLATEIWFLKSSGIFTVAVDKTTTLSVIKDNQIIAQRERSHQKYITVVKWVSINIFCTGGADAKVKKWNQKLQCLRTIVNHQKYVSSIAFTQKYIISAGHDNFIIFSDIQDSQKSSKMTTQAVQDMHYLNSKSKLLTITHSKNRSVLHEYNLTSKQQQRYVGIGQKIFYFEPSYCQNYLYMNCKSQEILMYHTNSLSLFRKFTGFCQENYIMRISPGGFNDQYLAVPSQTGEVLFYHSSRSEPISRIKVSQQTVINCVAWVNKNQVIFGCDNGSVQIYSVQDRQETKLERRDSFALRASQLFRNIIPQGFF